MWERNLLEIKGFNSLIPGLSSTGALEELAGWEKSYHILERYHNFMLSKIDKGYLSGKNLMAFEAVVEATKAEVASIITSLMLAGRQKGPYQRDSYLVDGLVTIGNRTLLELVVK